MKKNTRASALFVILMVAAATVLLVLNGRSRYQDYLAHHHQLAARAVTAAANEIALQIAEMRRLVGLFADEERQTIQYLADHPDDERADALFSEKVDRHFADRLAFTIAAADGTTLVDDLDAIVGESCRNDIHAFAGGNHPYEIYIHPQPGAYHFDVMARLREPGAGKAGVFFVSFRPTVIARLLGNSELPGHQLFLLLDNLHGLIEMGSAGSRDQMHRAFRLTPQERERITFRRPIKGTRWILVDVPDERLFDSVKQAIRRETGMFLVSLAVIAVFMLRFLKQSEERRFAAESGLRRAHHELETRVRDRTQRLADVNAELQKQVKERKSAERERREHQAILNAIVETAVDGIVVIDEVGTVQSFNPAAATMFGYTAEDVVGANVSMLMPEPFREEHDGYLARYLETGERRIIGVGREVPGRRKDGSTFPIDLAVSEIDLGNRRLFAGIVRDLSPRR